MIDNEKYKKAILQIEEFCLKKSKYKDIAKYIYGDILKIIEDLKKEF